MAFPEKQNSKRVLFVNDERILTKPKSANFPKPQSIDNSPNKKEVALKKAPEKEFSDKFKQMMRRLRFRLNLYMSVKRAKELSDQNIEPTHPEYKFLVKILKNPYRSNESAKRVLEYIKHLPFFNDFINALGDVEDRALEELCKRLKYEYVPAGNYIFKEGEKSDYKYYVVLRGQVSVVKKKDTNVFYQMRLARLKAIDEVKSEEEIKSENLIGEMGVKVKDINEGEGFEENALVERNSKRGCSILANTNCEFIIVLKEDYNQIISRFDNRRNLKKEFMMKNIPFIESINSMAIIEDLFFLIKDEDYPKDAIIAYENNVGNYIYFIASGECTVEKTFLINKTKKGTDYGSFEIKKSIANIDTGVCFGEELLIEDNKLYKYTVKVKSSSASFHFIEKSAFLMKFPPECIRMVLENFKVKDAVHQARIQEIEKEIVETAHEKNDPPPTLKGAEIFKLLRPQYRMKMAQHLYTSLKKNLSSTNLRGPQNTLDDSKSRRVREPNEETNILPIPQEPITPLRELRTKTPGRVFPTDLPDIHSILISNKSLSSGQNKALTKRQDDTREDFSDRDDFTKTLREKTSRGWIANPSKGISYKLNIKNSKEDMSGLEDKIIYEPILDKFPKMERFDFGRTRTPYLTDKYQKIPSLGQKGQISVGSFHTLRHEPSSVSIRGGQSDSLESKQQAKQDLINIIERVRGDRISPAVFSKISETIDKRRSKSNKKRLRKNADGKFIMIKSIATSSTRARTSMDFDLSPANLEQAAILEKDLFQAKQEASRSSLEVLDQETPNFILKKKIKANQGISKSLSENKLLNLVKDKTQEKIKEKAILRSHVWQLE